MEISMLLSCERSRLESARESLHYAAFWDRQRATIRRRIGRYMLLRFCDLHVPKEPHP